MNTRIERVEAACLLSPTLLRNMVEDRHPEIRPLEETDFHGYAGADDDTLIYRREGVNYLIQPVQVELHFCGYHIEAYGDTLWNWGCPEDETKWRQL